jgi:hypothetical protein
MSHMTPHRDDVQQFRASKPARHPGAVSKPTALSRYILGRGAEVPRARERHFRLPRSMSPSSRARICSTWLLAATSRLGPLSMTERPGILCSTTWMSSRCAASTMGRAASTWRGSSRQACTVIVADFIGANGYNPEFAGWGDEDVECYHRLEHIGSEVREWHRIPESRQAVIANLEWPELSDDEALSWSRRYFGHEASGPRFLPLQNRRSQLRAVQQIAGFPRTRSAESQQRLVEPDPHAECGREDRIHRSDRAEPSQARSRGPVNSGSNPVDQVPN